LPLKEIRAYNGDDSILSFKLSVETGLADRPESESGLCCRKINMSQSVFEKQTSRFQ
jgi:hypothetical protein